jgi:hypothetical protein
MIDLIDREGARSIRKNEREKENAAFGSTIFAHNRLYRGHGADAPLPTRKLLLHRQPGAASPSVCWPRVTQASKAASMIASFTAWAA